MTMRRRVMFATFGMGLIIPSVAMMQQADAANTAITASRALTTADCGTSLSNSTTTAYVLTVPASTLTVGCRIRVVQNGTGSITMTPASGETLGWYDFSSQASGTGSSELAGQYAAGVLTQETTTIATFGQGE